MKFQADILAKELYLEKTEEFDIRSKLFGLGDCPSNQIRSASAEHIWPAEPYFQILKIIGVSFQDSDTYPERRFPKKARQQMIATRFPGSHPQIFWANFQDFQAVNK